MTDNEMPGDRVRRAPNVAWYALPLAGLVAIWTAHLYYSVSRRPDVLWEDDWAVFWLPGYSRSFDLVNIFGTQNDTVAAYQNALQYLMLVATDLHLPSYIAVQNVFLLAFVIATWRLLASMDLGLGRGNRIGAVLAALLLVPVFTGTHHFEGTGMRFNHNMPIVYLALALLALRSPGLGGARQPVAGCLLFLSGMAYLSGWMYLLATTVALALVRLFAAPEEPAASRRADGIPGRPTMAGAWIALLAVVAVSISLSHRTYFLESGSSHALTPLVWPWDNRFWIFYLTTVSRGWGLPAGPIWGGIALSASVAPLLVLAIRLPHGSRRDAADAFALAAPVLGALSALAMITCGRALFEGTDTPTVETVARTHPKYLMHMTFALPFVAAAWMRTVADAPWWGSISRTTAVITVATAHIAGFVLGADGSLLERLDFRAVYGRSEAIIRDGGRCIENAVRLARATEPDVPIRCPGVFGKLKMRKLIQGAERAGVGSIAAIPDTPPVSPEYVSALVAEAAATPVAGQIDILEVGPTWTRVAGRAEMADDGSYPRWIAISVPGRPYWLARTTGGTGSNPRAGPAGSFDIVVPADERLAPGDVRVWALFGISGTAARAVRIGHRAGPLVSLLDAPPAGVERRGGHVEIVLWAPATRELSVQGWALADGDDDGRRLRFLASGAVSIVRFEEQTRPDVVAAHDDDARLLRSGFLVILEFPKGAKAPPCVRVWSEDQAFGRRKLTTPPDRDLFACVDWRGPQVALLDAPPAKAGARGGYVDTMLWDQAKRELTIHGWALTDSDDAGRQFHFLAPGAVSIVHFQEQTRPDVVAANGDDARLLHSGFSAVLKVARGAEQPPCVRIWSGDRAFGRRALTGPRGQNPAACGR